MNPRRVETACGAMMVPSFAEDALRVAYEAWERRQLALEALWRRFPYDVWLTHACIAHLSRMP